ncbi:MAG: FemAB family PEP-CTERM system-associated protein [Nitrospirae bacterium]|nr:FemAB family PEP-CTERM system-associated protein [Nitrospirota bacterium]
MARVNVIRIEQSNEEAVWDRYVGDHQGATIYHLTAWRHVIGKIFGHPTLYYMATDEQGEVRGILPLVYLKSRVFGRFLVSLPYFNYGGVIAESEEVRDALLAEAVRDAGALGASHIELRHLSGMELAWPKKEHKVSMRLDLPPRYEDLLKGFPPKLRSQIRRGEKEGMTVTVGEGNLIDEFYAVFSRNMRDLGTPVYGKNFFAEILRSFPKETKIAVVYLEEKPVAAGFVMGFRNTLEISWASSDRRYARLAPNMLLYGSVLRYACEQGYRIFDFGRSTKDSGTYRFKQQWGARPVQLEWNYWLRDGQPLPELNPQNPKYSFAIETWKRLPLPLTTLIGPRISKYLP